jgi:probable O-glycosylation ligase (exosortase A-associated)
MRDLALTAFVFGLLPFIFWRPHIGALTWAWLSMMIPHRLTYGFAHYFPFAQVVAITTLLALVFTKRKHPIPWHPVTVLLVIFVLWMSITSIFGLAPGAEIFDKWIQVIKIHVMLIVTLMLIRGREQIDQLIWVMVLSIGYYGAKGGVWVVLTGGGEKVWGPPGGLIGGNNELALALVTLIPIMFYLGTTAPRRWMRWGVIGAMVACGFSVLGSHSRGAFLALAAMALLLAIKSHRPVMMSLLLVIAAAIMVPFMPDHWTERMHSTTTHEDWSAVSRLHTWEMIWNLALDRPIVGGGFDFNSPYIVAQYATVEMKAYSPHSIYFQALGEHGFIGLFIFLLLIGYAWFRAGRLATACKAIADLAWVTRLMSMVQVSIVGFLVGGAFLNLLHFDFFYYLLALVVLADLAAVGQLQAAPQRVGIRTGTRRVAHGWSR